MHVFYFADFVWIKKSIVVVLSARFAITSTLKYRSSFKIEIRLCIIAPDETTYCERSVNRVESSLWSVSYASTRHHYAHTYIIYMLPSVRLAISRRTCRHSTNEYDNINNSVRSSCSTTSGGGAAAVVRPFCWLMMMMVIDAEGYIIQKVNNAESWWCPMRLHGMQQHLSTRIYSLFWCDSATETRRRVGARYIYMYDQTTHTYDIHLKSPTINQHRQVTSIDRLYLSSGFIEAIEKHSRAARKIYTWVHTVLLSILCCCTYHR